MKRLIALLVAVVLAMALAACGSQESDGTEPSSTTGSQEPSETTGETATDPTYAPGTVGVSSSGDLPTETLASTSGDLGTEPDLPSTDGDLSSDPTE